MITLEDLESIEPGFIFAQGQIANLPEGLYMTNSDQGRMLLWIAKKGYGNDWAIYVHWASSGIGFVETNGDKITSKKHIQYLVPCDDEVMSRYRF